MYEKRGPHGPNRLRGDLLEAKIIRVCFLGQYKGLCEYFF